MTKNEKTILKDKRKVLLIIRDGWGYAERSDYNLIALADTPYTDYLENEYPEMLLGASGVDVGLPADKFGNSEVGHMTIGAGRVVKQSLLRINDAIEENLFEDNEAIMDAIYYAKKHSTHLHLIGLLQKEGVHASMHHLFAILETARDAGLGMQAVCVHVITDGRDAEPQHALKYIVELTKKLEEIGVGYIASLGGRYYAMDRNKHWNRTGKYWTNALMGGSRYTYIDPVKYIKKLYKDETFSDRFLKPTHRNSFTGIKDNDAVIFYNFRKDRAMQLSHVFVDEEFHNFYRNLPRKIYFTAMTEYFDGLPSVAFKDIPVDYPLAMVLAHAGKTQLRIAESEKYAHVTYFFDGGKEISFLGEKRIIIPSPDVETYDKKPEMAAPQLTKELLEKITLEQFDFILCNFANADMVGHTAKRDATIRAVETVDKSIQKIVPRAIDHGYTVLITADHGNAEYKHNKFETSHTNNPVQFILVTKDEEISNMHLKKDGTLANIASTVLKILDISPPERYEDDLFI